MKFVLYFIFMVFYYIDLESIEAGYNITPEFVRYKGIEFLICKSVCFTIQIAFFVYELI